MAATTARGDAARICSYCFCASASRFCVSRMRATIVCAAIAVAVPGRCLASASNSALAGSSFCSDMNTRPSSAYARRLEGSIPIAPPQPARPGRDRRWRRRSRRREEARAHREGSASISPPLWPGRPPSCSQPSRGSRALTARRSESPSSASARSNARFAATRSPFARYNAPIWLWTADTLGYFRRSAFNSLFAGASSPRAMRPTRQEQASVGIVGLTLQRLTDGLDRCVGVSIGQSARGPARAARPLRGD